MNELTPHQLQLLTLAALFPFGAYLVSKLRPSWLICVGLAAEVFSGNWQTMGIRVPLDRLLLLGGFFNVVINRETRKAVRANLPQVTPLLVAISVYVLISGFINQSIFGGKGFWMLFDRLGFFPFASFIIAPVVFRQTRDREVFLKIFVCVGAYLSITAVFEIVGPHALVFPSYINSTAIVSHLGRARGPFVEAVPNGMAMFSCGVVSLLAAHLLESNRWKKLAMAIAPLSCVGAFLSLTRSVWLGSICGILIAIIFAPRIRKQMMIGLAGLGLVVVLLLFTVPGLNNSVTGRTEDQASIWDRVNTNNAAFAMIRDKPIFGVGWNTFTNHSPDYIRQTGQIPLTGLHLEVHNMPLSFAAELGLMGSALWAFGFLGALSTAVLNNWRSNRYVAVAVLAVFFSWLFVAVLSPLDQAFPHLFMWTLAGFAIAHASASKDVTNSNEVDLRERISI